MSVETPSCRADVATQQPVPLASEPSLERPAPAWSRGDARALLGRLSRNSVIYAVANVAQMAVGFLLLPLYTRCLSPDDYGVLTTVLVIGSFLNMLFLLAMNSAMGRFWYEYRDRPEVLKEFWGTVLTFLFLVSATGGGILLACGGWLLQGVLGDVPFWPLMALGVMAVVFQPFTDAWLTVLQNLEKPIAYASVAVSSVAFKTVLAIVLVGGIGLGVRGALLANAACAAVFFGVVLLGMRRQVVICLKMRHLRQALAYSLPLLPHTLAAQLKLILDRLFLFHLVGKAASGLYNVGFQFSIVANVVCLSVNRAFLPIFMSAMKEEREEQLEEVRRLGLLMVVAYCWICAAIALFAPWVIRLFTGPAFHESWRVVPLLTFSFAALGIYFLFVNVLFYHRHTTKYVPIGTVGGLVLSVLLNLVLVPPFGMMGAALAALVAQLGFTVITAIVAHRYSRLRWPYARFAILWCTGFAVSLLPLVRAPQGLDGAVLSALALVLLFFVASAIAWQSPLHPLRRLREALPRGAR